MTITYHNQVFKEGIYDTEECLHFVNTLTGRNMRCYSTKSFFNNNGVSMNINYVEWYGKPSKYGVQFFENKKMTFGVHYNTVEEMKTKACSLIQEHSLMRRVRCLGLTLED